MESMEKNLAYLGISGKEKDLYFAILKQKRATVIQLAKMTSIKRTTVYHCLDSLIEKGLANEATKEGKKYYYAEDPKISLHNMLEEKKNVVNLIIPELKSIFGQSAYQPEIKVYRQIAGLRRIFSEIIETKEKVFRYYISDFNMEETLGLSFVDKLAKERIDRGIKSFSLRSFKYKPEREQYVAQAKQNREIKFFPDGFLVQPYMCIYDNKVVMISTKEEQLGFVIESKEFSDAQKAIFDLIWNSVAI